jgi:hypothetical protein
MCMIPVRGEPCVSCRARSKECTFLMGPTARKRRTNADAGPSRRPQPEASRASSSGLDGWSEPSPSHAIFPRPDDVVPLDDEAAEDEETHFVGLGFFGLLPRDAGAAPTFSRHATLAFRQVSADPRRPAYFIKHPSLLYGRGPSSASAALDEVRRLCATVAPDIPARALHLYVAPWVR